ncbi:uncharacterized protein PHACADRAFT_194921 [Phanerochaete carnosa HHB-10118-sp]|uniref:DUF221-domain-containing protein n=1 Tax=Phanerochaete carnosa (strain HHB-10118-sp) TaxID=650164 RepID=K5X3J8_PHACS|nr:uncharacterized protein PHACADRAFT_194921 [Phanerochaete carnosa HHB-10118-sp]EKM57367.1 hypothetical protein PHACADRAFT_194921 [Phanerochaete carnosa HHB-10118-sp]
MSQVTPGKADGTDSQTFLTALITNASILAIEVIAFVVLRSRLWRIYEPRTYLPPPDKRAVSLPGGWWKWLLAIVTIPTGDIMQKNGMDAYMFLRFLRLLIILFASITVLTWLVLLPVDTAGLPNANFTDRLSRLSWGKLSDTWLTSSSSISQLAIWTLFLIRRELVHYTLKRHEFLTSSSHATLAQARTVLIINVPPEMCDEHELRRWASFVPGGVQNVWIYRDTRTLNGDYNARLEACQLLEQATSKLIRKVVRAKHKEEKKLRKDGKAPVPLPKLSAPVLTKRERTQHLDAYLMQERRVGHDIVDTGRGPSLDSLRTAVGAEKEKAVNPFEDVSLESVPASSGSRHSRTRTSILEAGQLSPGGASTVEKDVGIDAEALLEKYALPKKRPHHRLGFMGLFGKKVDTIKWCMDEISKLNKSIEEKRGALAQADKMPKPLGSAFIQCNLQMGAHVLAQCVSYHKPLMMAEKFIEVSPKDVIWDNIDDGAYEARFRYVTSWMGSIALIVLWFAPVAFVGTLSNVSTLCQKVAWLCWIRNAPTPIPGMIQGILPPLALAVLFAILPWLLRGLAWYENIPRWSLLSISVYKRYFLFLVIHGFLIVTLSSGLTSTAAQIVENPTQALSYLASQLPNASIFFLTWTLTQGLSGAGSALLQVGTILLYFAKKWFLGRTPRQAYEVTFMMPKADFGLVLPRISLLATIALAYSVLSPIINGLAMLSFLLFFMAWKFLLTWVFDQPDEAETGGQYFPLAINFLFVGMYIEQFCLAVLFFLKISNGISFLAEGVLMLFLMAVTLSAQVLFQRSFDPITQFLPMSLATEQLQKRWESHRLHKHSGSQDSEMNLFSKNGLKMVVNRHLVNPVEKLAKHVENNMAKVADIQSDVGHGSTENDVAHGSTSAYDSAGHRRHNSHHHVHHHNPHYNDAHQGHQQTHHRRTKSTHRSGDSSLTKAPRRLPQFAPAAPKRPVAAEDEGDVDEDFDAHGFDHPSTYEEQPWIWVPKDALGLSEVFVREYRTLGVEASDEGAVMDERGNVEVNRSPPDEEWHGGHDA